eukprot:gene14235-10177_t
MHAVDVEAEAAVRLADDAEVAGEADDAAVDHEGVAHVTPFDTGGAGQGRVVIGGRVVEELGGD